MYRIVGSILNVIPEKLISVLEVKYPDLKSHPRVFGFDIELNNKYFELFINSFDDSEYHIDISFNEKENILINFLNELKQTLLKLDVPFELTYFEEDLDGNQLSDDQHFFKFNPSNQA